MATLYADSDDGYQQSPLSSNWDDAHDNLGQLNPWTSGTNYAYAVRAGFVAARSKYVVGRAFFSFPFGGLGGSLPAGHGITAATFNFQPRTNAAQDFILLKSGHDHNDATEDWFSTWLTGLGGTISGWSNSDSQITPYSAVTSPGSVNAYTSVTLNKAFTDLATEYATSELPSTSRVNIVMMADNDYSDTANNTDLPTTGLYFQNWSSTSRDPYIEYTVGALGYGNDVSGVASGDIHSINGILTGNIESVIK